MSFLASLPDGDCILPFPSLPDLGAWVTVDGEPARLFGRAAGDKKASAYVEAVEGARFAVHWVDFRTLRPETAFEMALEVDGLDCHGTVVPLDDGVFGDPLSSANRVVSYEGREVTESLIRPFRFAALQTTDDDNLACQDEHFVRGVGSIGLKYLRIDDVAPADRRALADVPAPVLDETAKKAGISHQTLFDEPAESMSSATFRNFHRIDRKHDPFSTVEFKYRSTGALMVYMGASPNDLKRDRSLSLSLSAASSSAASSSAASSSAAFSHTHHQPVDTSPTLSSTDGGRAHALRRLRNKLDELAKLRKEIRQFERLTEEEEDELPMLKRVKVEEEEEGATPRGSTAGREEGKGTGKNGEVEVVVLD
ncbi:hypothetical protein JCM10213_002393 [Rhodosporidiobolus nylandii]